MHLSNVYSIDVSLSQAFLAGVYPIDMHLIDVHLIGVHLLGIHLLGVYLLQACISYRRQLL
jgi:hypothetical protein